MTEYKEWQRSYLGYRERFVDSFDVQVRNGRCITLQQAPTAGKRGADFRSEGDAMVTGTTVWDAGIMLAHFLADTDLWKEYVKVSDESETPIVVELGSGTGLVSLALAASEYRAKYVLTDIPSMVSFIDVNVKKNAKTLRGAGGVQDIQVCALRWANKDDIVAFQSRHGQHPDVIIGSDILYSEQTPQGKLLLSTFKELCSTTTQIFISAHKHHNPALVDEFVADAQNLFRTVDDITHMVPPEWLCENGLLLRLTNMIMR